MSLSAPPSIHLLRGWHLGFDDRCEPCEEAADRGCQRPRDNRIDGHMGETEQPDDQDAKSPAANSRRRLWVEIKQAVHVYSPGSSCPRLSRSIRLARPGFLDSGR